MKSAEISPGAFSMGSVLPNSLVAGYVAGICGTIIGHPLDSLKVLLQTRFSTVSVGPTSASSSSPNIFPKTALTPTTSTNRNIVSMSSGSQHPSFRLRSLYAGVSGPLLTVGLIQCINFSIYDTCRQRFYYKSHPHNFSNYYLYHDSIFNVGLSAFISGGVVSFITSPLSIIKTKQQIMCWGFHQALVDTLGTHSSWSKFFLGFGPHFVCESLGRSVYLMTYESLKRSCIKLKTDVENPDVLQHLPLWQRMICAAMSGIASWSVIFPCDVIRSRIYFESISEHSSIKAKSTYTMIQHMYRENGKKIGIFFRGYTITIVRAGPVAAVVLPVYDKMLDLLRGQSVLHSENHP